MFPGNKPTLPPPAPTIDTAAVARDQRDRSAARRATTILTSDTGLPDLGATARPGAF